MVKTKVKLVAKTFPMIDGINTTEEFIAYVARVSNPGNQMNNETSAKLLKYLIKNHHWSPFEMAHFIFEIKTTRDIGRQILRHRSFSFQEFCVSGDTKISFETPHSIKNPKRRKGQKTHTIEYLYDRWTNKKGMKHRIKNMMIRVYDTENNVFTYSHIKDIFQTGIKPVFKITFTNGKTINCTKEHKFLTKNGFVPLNEAINLQLSENNIAHFDKNEVLFATNGINIANDTARWTKISKVEYLGEQQTYDIEVEHPSHNYVANGIVVHNSGRYAMYDMDNLELREARLQDTKNRQNSLVTDDDDIKRKFELMQKDIAALAAEYYNSALDMGVAKEQARAILPEGLVPTTIYMSGTVRSWIHYIAERNRPGVVQAEHVEIAAQILEAIKPEIPSISELIMNN